MGIDMSFLRLLLQDLAEVILPDAPKEGSHLMRFLEHPLGKKDGKKTVKRRAQFTNTSLFGGSSSAKADGTQTVASQQTYCLRYMRAASCRKQPKSNPAAHRETILIQALLLPPGVLKTVSSPYLHKPNNLRLHPSTTNTDCV